jgi:thioredoxin-like negative regulator of GroEL
MVDVIDSDDRPCPCVAGADLYVKPKPHPLKASYPELFQAEAVILTFGASWCGPCARQEAAFLGHVKEYYILKVDVDEEKWAALKAKLGLGGGVPVTVILHKGEVVKEFRGFTPWDKIEPHAKKAKRPEVKAGPLRRLFQLFQPQEPGQDFRAWLTLAWEWLQENWATVLKIALSLLVLL